MDGWAATLLSAAWTACAVVGASSLLLYLLPLAVYTYLLPEQNLKAKYRAEWGKDRRVQSRREPPTAHTSGR